MIFIIYRNLGLNSLTASLPVKKYLFSAFYMPEPTISTKITAENEIPKIPGLMDLTFLGGRQTISKKFQIVSSMKKMKQCDSAWESKYYFLVYDQRWIFKEKMSQLRPNG